MVERKQSEEPSSEESDAEIEVEVRPLDPGENTCAWLATAMVFFESTYGKFSKVPTFGFLPGRAYDPKYSDDGAEGEVLATTGSGLGRDIIFSERVLQSPYSDFFTTVFHELHEYRLWKSGPHPSVSVVTRAPDDPIEYAVELQARKDWQAFRRLHKLSKGGGPIAKLDMPAGLRQEREWKKRASMEWKRGRALVLPPPDPPPGEQIVTAVAMERAVNYLSKKHAVPRPVLRYQSRRESSDRKNGKRGVICVVHQNGEHEREPVSEQCRLRFAEDLIGSFQVDNGQPVITVREDCMTLETLWAEFYHYLDWKNAAGKKVPHSNEACRLHDVRAKREISDYLQTGPRRV